MVFAWLVLCIVLVAVELHHLAFYALFGAVAALVAALVALVAPGAIALQAGVAVAVTAAGIAALRPYVSRRFGRSGAGSGVARGVHGGLVGQEALTLDTVGDTHRPGHVRLAGERWLAVSGTGQPLEAGTPVVISAVQGTTFVVWPMDSLGLPSLGEPPSVAPQPLPQDVNDAPQRAEGGTS